jgi:hypothetical protein
LEGFYKETASGAVTKERNQSSHWEQTVFLAAMGEMAGVGAVDA